MVIPMHIRSLMEPNELQRCKNGAQYDERGACRRTRIVKSVRWFLQKKQRPSNLQNFKILLRENNRT